MPKAQKNKSEKLQRFNKGRVLVICFIFTLTALTLFNMSFYFFSRPKVVYAVAETWNKKISFWQNFLVSHPTYFEGWIALSELQIKEGNVEGARYSLEQARKINPNSEELKPLSDKLAE